METLQEGRAIVSTANRHARGAEGLLPSPSTVTHLGECHLWEEEEGPCGPGEKEAEKEELGKEGREGGEAKPLPLPPPSASPPAPPSLSLGGVG